MVLGQTLGLGFRVSGLELSNQIKENGKHPQEPTWSRRSSGERSSGCGMVGIEARW